MRFLPLALASLSLAAGDTTAMRRHYDAKLAPRAVPLLQEVLRFPTVQGDVKAREAQQAWVKQVGTELGFVVRDAGLVTEVELPGPDGAPVLGLVVHGDVQPVDDHWTIPPFQGAVKDGFVLGRGAADDKGPLVQALLAMKALKEAGPARTHTIRLLVGSDEESTNLDIASYLKDHAAPDYSLVLDSGFPVVVGEKAWSALTLTTASADRGEAGNRPHALSLEAGLATSIVPDRAELVLSALPGDLATRLKAKPLPPGIRMEIRDAHITTFGRAAHGGVNLEGGRNALVALARIMEGELPPGGADDLLAFARQAGQDLYGTGLGLTESDPVFGRCAVNVATIKSAGDGRLALTINVRATPKLYGPALEAHFKSVVTRFSEPRGAAFEVGGFFGDPPLAFDPDSKLVKRLMADYARATGHAEKPAISGGGTYAKRLPHAIAFGMWFPGKPYPGHDVDEKLPIADLHAGVHVLLEALGDLACGKPLVEPFKP